jgi:RNA polymerase sigma factor (sigma-70 family)
MALSKQAFEDRVLELLGRLDGLARRLTCNETDAEDLVAETVARAWQARDSLESEAAFRAWIFRILHNTFVSEWRRARAGPQLEAFESSEAEDDGASAFSIFEQLHQPFLLWFGNPERQFVDDLLREHLERALAMLPENHRVVVLLADVQEFSYPEIAEALGIPVGTVRSRLARARSSLQRALWRQAKDYGLRGEPESADGREREEERT